MRLTKRIFLTLSFCSGGTLAQESFCCKCCKNRFASRVNAKNSKNSGIFDLTSGRVPACPKTSATVMKQPAGQNKFVALVDFRQSEGSLKAKRTRFRLGDTSASENKPKPRRQDQKSESLESILVDWTLNFLFPLQVYKTHICGVIEKRWSVDHQKMSKFAIRNQSWA